MGHIFVSTYPFGRENPNPINILKSSGFKYQINPLGRKLKPSELLSMAQDYEVLIAGTEDLTLLVENSSHLKMISRVGIGLDSVPLDLCRKKKIQIAYTPDAVTQAVAEMTLSFMITMSRHLSLADKTLRKGQWVRYQGKSIPESVVGLVGFGRVGQLVAKYLAALGPKEILINDIETKDLEIFKKLGLNIQQVGLTYLLQSADIISLHVPLTAQTKHLIDQKTLAQIKPSSVLINTCRGAVICEQDLIESLQNSHLAAAALDVFFEEPYSGPLINFENVFLTQHMGSCSHAARLRMETEAAQEAIRFLSGQPLHNPVLD